MSTITAAQLQYMEAHPNDNRAPGIIACGVICLAVSVIVVAMRLISRRMVHAPLGLDDFMIILSLILMIAFSTFLFLTTRYGMGKHIIYISSAKWLTICITAAEALYVLTIMTVKCAILFFYRRIFPQRWFHNLIWVIMAIVISYNLSCFFATIMQCMPVKHQWDPSVPAKCIDYYAVVVYSGVLNVVSDFVILGMPIPLISRLQISKKKRMELIIVFSWGMAACVVSIARTVTASALTSDDSSWQLAGALYSTCLDVCMGMVSACVPTLRPIVAYFWKSVAETNPFSSEDSGSKSYVLSTNDQGTLSGPQSRRGDQQTFRSSGEIHILKEYQVAVR